MPDVNVKELNRNFLDKLTSDSPELVKEAQSGADDYLRMRMREDGFLRRIIPPTPITPDELDRDDTSVLPSKVVDKEPESPAAVSLPFATLPMNWYITQNRYRINLGRIETPRFTTDVGELYTADADIRAILSANAIKDALAEEDGTFIAVVNTLVGNEDVVVPAAGIALNQTIAGGVTRATVNDAFMILDQTPAAVPLATVLANQTMAKQIQKWGRDEFGGDISEEIARNGLAERTLFGARWLFTIKRNLVPDNVIYMFAPPKYLGRFYVLDDLTMHLKKEAYFMWWFAYELIGCGIGNQLALARVRFTD